MRAEAGHEIRRGAEAMAVWVCAWGLVIACACACRAPAAEPPPVNKKGLARMAADYRPTLLKNPSLTTIPPGPVTDKIRVEVRLSVPNPSSEARNFTLSLYWDKADPEHLIASR
ncbi:MAG TPA: hypothetical protein VNJ09_07165, partial [Chthonomonadales bacterium]|nr:hypothetical protein [Chthonomonadales bacterium]